MAYDKYCWSILRVSWSVITTLNSPLLATNTVPVCEITCVLFSSNATKWIVLPVGLTGFWSAFNNWNSRLLSIPLYTGMFLCYTGLYSVTNPVTSVTSRVLLLTKYLGISDILYLYRI